MWDLSEVLEQREGVRIPDFELYSEVTDMKESDSTSISFYYKKLLKVLYYVKVTLPIFYNSNLRL